MENETRTPEKTARGVLSRLSAYARERGLCNKALAEELGIPYRTLQKWYFFTESEAARRPSKPHMDRIEGFLESTETAEIHDEVQEARRRVEKIKYLLLLLEDELRWFRDNGQTAREQFRRELNSSDIGYVSSLLTMLTDEAKFKRWLAFTTTHFRFFRR